MIFFFTFFLTFNHVFCPSTSKDLSRCHSNMQYMCFMYLILCGTLNIVSRLLLIWSKLKYTKMKVTLMFWFSQSLYKALLMEIENLSWRHWLKETWWNTRFRYTMDRSEIRAGYFQKLSGYLTDLCSGTDLSRVPCNN